MLRTIIFASVGLMYGCLLSAIGMGAANGGDGTMLPLYVFSSPLFLPLLFFAPPVIWCSIAAILSNVSVSKYRTAFFILLGIHYLGIVPYWLIVGDWDRFLKLAERSPASAVILSGAYVVGNIALWLCYINRSEPETGTQ